MRGRLTVATVMALLICVAASAQTIPEWMIGDFAGESGQIDIQMKLVDFNSPWSTPDPRMSHVLFGEVSFLGYDGAEVLVSEIASMNCSQPIGCYAYNSRPLYMHQRIPWAEPYGTYIWMTSGAYPAFSVLTVDLASVSAYWSSGMFEPSGTAWIINSSAFYSLYLIEPLTMPIFPYVPAPSTPAVR